MSNKKEIVKVIKERIKLNVPKVEIEKELISKYKTEEFSKILSNFPEPELKQKYKKYCTTLIILAYVLAILGVFHGFVLGRTDSPDATVRVAGALDGLIFSLAVAVMGLSMIKQFQKISFYLVVLMSIFFLFKGILYPIAITTGLQIILCITTLIISMFLFRKMFPKIKKTDTPIAQ